MVLRHSKFAYESVAVGGTFDMLHEGHKRLLGKAFQLGTVVYVGVSGNNLVSILQKNHPVRSFTIRSRNIRRFLRSRGWLSRARVVELNDPYGPATRRKNLQALIVSEETRSSGFKVNQIRKKRGLSPLRLHIVKMAKSADGRPISVTRMRRGELNATGRLIELP